MSEAIDVVVGRSDLRRCEVRPAAVPALAEGEARLRVDAFALTANNVTYGAVGDMIGYWQFFPAAEGWGRIPVWGFADVVESRCAALPVGERVFGYLPMSTFLVVQPAQVSAAAFVDAAPHRAALPPIYNQYTRVAALAGHTPAHEPALALFRPLFTTAFLLDDQLAEHGDFGAAHAVLTSASSKTALGLAFLLSRARRLRVVGLTSARHTGFVERTGYYDAVVSYDDLGALPAAGDAVSVDFAGNPQVLAAIHTHFGDRLRHSGQVGLTHWQAFAPPPPLPGPTPVFFFAPDQAAKRVAEWGAAELQRRVGAALTDFAASAAAWLRIVEHRGPQALVTVYGALVDGATDPAEGHIVRLGGAA